MPEQPFAITQREEVAGLVQQIEALIADLYQDRVGGADIGDVFSLGTDDVLNLQVSSTGGLEKSGGYLIVKLPSTGGLESDATGLMIKVKDDSGLTVDGDGLQVVVRASYGINMDSNGLALKKQAHEANASTSHGVTNWATTNAALDALGTKINSILSKLENAEVFASS